MMIWLLFILSTSAFAQSDSNLKAIQKLDEELPTFDEYEQSIEESEFDRQQRKFKPPYKLHSMEKIKASGTQMMSLSAGSPVRNLTDNKNYSLVKQTYVKVYNLEDEHGFKYIVSKDGSVKWRVQSRFTNPIKQELELYEPPTKYTPAPKNIVRAEYDKKLTIRPEFNFYAGIVQGDFMKDLFNDNKASSGTSTQYGVHFFTDWKLPIKVGAVLHYERASFELSDGGKVDYSSISLGPQIKSREFEIFEQPIRFQMHFRVSPLAKATAETASGAVNYKFNSADVLTSIERPIKNSWGEFVLGAYFQAQWLNLKDQSDEVSVEASNEINKSFGLSLAQVF